jgi:hypothetical protein
VVIASLVRSNDDGAVGFMREPERIDVLNSRARLGFILIGNSNTFRRSKNAEARKHWGEVLEKLEHTGSLLTGLPAQCQQHGTRVLLDSPQAFTEKSPSGGCCLPCDEKLPCGHICHLRCHAYDRSHEHIMCTEPQYDFCGEGHLVVRK